MSISIVEQLTPSRRRQWQPRSVPMYSVQVRQEMVQNVIQCSTNQYTTAPINLQHGQVTFQEHWLRGNLWRKLIEKHQIECFKKLALEVSSYGYTILIRNIATAWYVNQHMFFRIIYLTGSYRSFLASIRHCCLLCKHCLYPCVETVRMRLKVTQSTVEVVQ